MRDAVFSRRDEAARSTRGSVLRSVLIYLNLAVVVVLSLGLAGVTHRVVESAGEKDDLAAHLERTEETLRAMEGATEARIRNLIERDEAERKLILEGTRSYEVLIDTIASRLDLLETQNRQARVEAVASLRRELDEIRSTVGRSETAPRTWEDTFRSFEAQYRRGVVLIYSEFDYTKMRDGRETRSKTVSGWGSGFFIGDGRYIVTNKHVVQPWKFDADIATMMALGEIRVDESSVRIAAWENGTRAFNDYGDPNFDIGFNNTIRRNLEIYAEAPDHMSEHVLDIGLDAPRYQTHDLDNNDLVILRISGTPSKDMLPCAAAEEVERLGKLSPIMALGFPRGQNGLERGRVESSPSIGTIRKIENTIHVTASIIPGNSGGPLVGADGKVIGVVTRIYSETLGICIKIDHVTALMESQKRAEDITQRAMRRLHFLR